MVGTESLLIQCADALQKRGHEIAAIVTARPAIVRWALEQRLRVLPNADALVAALDLGAIDYLFSITNLSILRDDVIALPTKGAINFHDGPLPEYAGVNIPVWALLNGEQRHGVTWHLMTGSVDQGDILAERRFDVDRTETSLTLNTKCFEAGMESFEVLVDGLASGTIRAVPQVNAPERYFGHRDRPDAASTIRWDRSGAQIARLVRALDFGTYANPLGLPKASYEGQLLLALEASETDRASMMAPGTIVSIEPAALVVATATSDIQLRRFGTLTGDRLDVPAAVARFGFAEGGCFDVLADTLAEQLTSLDAAAAVHERFWLRRLETMESIELPYIDATVSTGTTYRHADLELAETEDSARSDSVLAAAVGYLARLADKAQFDVGFSCMVMAAQFGNASAWFAPQVPLRASIDFEGSFNKLRDTIGAELREIRRRVGYCADLVARTPTLRAAAVDRDLGVLPVALTLVEQLDHAVALSGSDLTIAIRSDGLATRWIYDADRLSGTSIECLQAQFATLIAAADADPRRPLAELPLMTEAQQQTILVDFNDTAEPWRNEACVHELIAEQARRTPERAAVICGERTLSYSELDRRANQLARHLASLGVGPDVLVGLFVERSLEMVVGLLAIHKAGGAYVPLDPAYPADRLAYMVEESRTAVVLTQASLKHRSSFDERRTVCLDADWPLIEALSSEPFESGVTPRHLAYVIFTSGSTGRPKGVMVEHRNVANFFAGIDTILQDDDPGVWLAVTSLSFDISVLELCWTLTRGYSVVIYTGEERQAEAPRLSQSHRAIDFSLFYFSSDESEGATQKYRLLLEGAKFADANGFEAVWTPERHFHAFGGLYPNPSVTSAAVAAITERVKIRSGSVVLPLHHPVRVAEEWSVVDNLSDGRVGISFASGWQPNDFALRPENFADNKNILLRDIDVVRRLWRGETMSFPGPLGTPVELKVLPRPVQAELPFWVTSAGNPETFAAAGRLGANVLTHLLGQTVEELIEKLATYREAWKAAGHPGEGHVTLMLHSFVGPDVDMVRQKVRQPLIEYLRSSTNLVKQYAWSFPAFKRPPGTDASNATPDLESLTGDEMDALLEHSFGRYYDTSGLFGTPESCLAMIDRIKASGVDEVACLIDFGVDAPTVIEHLPYLNELRQLSKPRASEQDQSLPALIERHRVTHLQCTPSMAGLILADPAAAPAFAKLKRLMIGGEAFPPALAADLTRLVGGHIMNMYGPTETTIWSAAAVVDAGKKTVPLGRPLANQEIYVLDQRGKPVPPGVAGEIMIGGLGVVRGYLDRPELTADRFVPHPFRAEAMVYRTGDLGRITPDGTLEFLGRLDHQVKLRGYRIELGEIEALLASDASVREAVVLAREDVPGDQRLVAYVTPSAGLEVMPDQLRERLREQLPEFMVPARVVVLAGMPQTPNGKLDRKAFPAPDAEQALAPSAFVAPADGLEERIAAVWRDTLKLVQVGTRDNFFDLGGHSLLAVQAHRRLQIDLNRKLSLTDMFRFPTIQSLSAYLSRQSDDNAPVQAAQNRAQGRLAALQRRQAQRNVATADRWS